MWDTIETTPTALSHDRLCVHCTHALHIYLACDQDCECGPQTMPGLAEPDTLQGFAA